MQASPGTGGRARVEEPGEASAGFEPAVEVLHVGLNGPVASVEVPPEFRIASYRPVKSVEVRSPSRALPSLLPSSPVANGRGFPSR